MDGITETPVEVLLAREESVATKIEWLIDASRTSIVAALYRLNSTRLGEALRKAAERGVRIRLVLDRTKYEQTKATRQILDGGRLAFRLTDGRTGRKSKMHHKFALVDERLVLTGSYNWTDESEDENYENLLILREPTAIETYGAEFEKLWKEAAER